MKESSITGFRQFYLVVVVLLYLAPSIRGADYIWIEAESLAKPPIVFAYLVKFEDSSALEVPVRYDRGVGHWIASEPAGFAEAIVAWSAPFPKDPTRQAVVYQMMWKNPRPALTIKSIDVKHDDKFGNQYGVPIIMGITAGTAE